MAPKKVDVATGSGGTLAAERLPNVEIIDFDHFAAARKTVASMTPTLTAKYGLPPLGHAGLFDVPLHHTDAAFHAFRQHLRTIRFHLNRTLADEGATYRVTDPQLLTNMLAEGTILYLRGLSFKDQQVHFFKASGVGEYVLEKGEKNNVSRLLPSWYKYSPGFGDFRSSLMANAGYFTAVLGTTVSAITPGKWAALPPEGQFFWQTVEYNTVHGGLQGMLRSRGLNSYKAGWTKADQNMPRMRGDDGKPDPAKFKMAAQYNASWRTATFELMNTIAQSDPDPEHVEPERKEVLAGKSLPLNEVFDLEEARFGQVSSAAADEFGAREVLYLIRKLRDAWRSWMYRMDEKAAYKSAMQKDLKVLEPKFKALAQHQVKADEYLKKLHGPRGQKLGGGPAAQDVVAFYTLLNSTIEPVNQRETPNVAQLSDDEFKREWLTLKACGVPTRPNLNQHKGFLLLKSPFGDDLDAAAAASVADVENKDDKGEKPVGAS